MGDFLSDRWFEELNARLAASTRAALPAGTRPSRIVLDLVDAPVGAVSAVTLALADARVSVAPGAVEEPDAVLRLSFRDAADLAAGALDSASALREGRVKVRGDVNVLVPLAGWLLDALAAGPAAIADGAPSADYPDRMPAVEHVEPAFPRLTGTEGEVTWSMVDYCRSVVLLKCQNLSDEQLKRRATPPSALSLLGLLRHLTKVEHYWFQRCFLGREEAPLYSTAQHPNADFDDLDSVDPRDVVALFVATCAASRAAAREHGLDEIAAQQRSGDDVSLRYIAVHMVDEYARHLGHADLLREAIDGATGG